MYPFGIIGVASRYLPAGVVKRRFVDDLTDNWGQEYVDRRDTRDDAPFSDNSLVVLSGPFKQIVNKEPTITACLALSNRHSCGRPYFCTLADVKEGLSKFVLPDLS